MMELLVINAFFSLLGLTVLVWGVVGIRKLDSETNEILEKSGSDTRV